MNIKSSAFDTEQATRTREARTIFLESILNELLKEAKGGINCVLDAGCGVGLFSDYLAKKGFRVDAFDARENNIAEAKKRYPEPDFHVGDIEDPSIRQMGIYDMILCFGLLYHLENPFVAVRNLHEMTGKFVIVETRVAPSRKPVALLKYEPAQENQALRNVALVPSAGCLVKMLYCAGFKEVYRTRELPAHIDFRTTFKTRQKRIILIASKIPLSSSQLVKIPDPELNQEIWHTLPVSFYLWFFRGILRRGISALIGTVLKKGNHSSGTKK